MGSVDVLREITPLSPEDCFLVMQRPKRSFSYPLHVHPEFELNYLENAAARFESLVIRWRRWKSLICYWLQVEPSMLIQITNV